MCLSSVLWLYPNPLGQNCHFPLLPISIALAATAVLESGMRLGSDSATYYLFYLTQDLTSLGLSVLLSEMGTKCPSCKGDSQDWARSSVSAVCECTPRASAVKALRLWGIPHWRDEDPADVLTGLCSPLPSPLSCVLTT